MSEIVPAVIEGEVVTPATLDDCVALWKKAEEVEGRCQELKARVCFECLSQGLWRERHASFGEFCEKELGVKLQRASRLAAAYEVRSHVNSPAGEFREWQLRPLTHVKKSAGRNWRPINEAEVKMLKSVVKNARAASTKKNEGKPPEAYYKHFVAEARHVDFEEKPVPLDLLEDKEKPRSCSIDLDWEGSAKRVIRALRALGYDDEDWDNFVQIIQEGKYGKH